ncbi:BTB/POZ domain protein, putative (DUF177) [Wolffia australiana]
MTMWGAVKEVKGVSFTRDWGNWALSVKKIERRMAFVLSAPFWGAGSIPASSGKFRKAAFSRPRSVVAGFAKFRLGGLAAPPSWRGARAMELEFGEEDEEGSPWEGAVVYRRDSGVTHVEYGTTLERLGLGKLSGELSKSRASAMGIRLGASAGTPVLVSIDVTRKKRKLKLDGVLRTVILLGCNRCGGPAAESVFCNFAFLLTEDPVEDDGDEIDLGTIFGSEKTRARGDGNEDEDELIDPEDRLHFPAEEKAIDISKNIRDLVHLEMTMNAVCDPGCKGLCYDCGANLNQSRCRCGGAAGEKLGEFGPLASLKRQMGER